MKADHPSVELSGRSPIMDHHHRLPQLPTSHPPPWMAAMAASSIPWPFIPQVLDRHLHNGESFVLLSFFHYPTMRPH